MPRQRARPLAASAPATESVGATKASLGNGKHCGGCTGGAPGIGHMLGRVALPAQTFAPLWETLYFVRKSKPLLPSLEKS